MLEFAALTPTHMATDLHAQMRGGEKTQQSLAVRRSEVKLAQQRKNSLDATTHKEYM